MENKKITYDGLAQLPTDKAELNKWIDTLKESVNCDTGHLSDRACTIATYARLLKDKSDEIFEIFNQQKEAVYGKKEPV